VRNPDLAGQDFWVGAQELTHRSCVALVNYVDVEGEAVDDSCFEVVEDFFHRQDLVLELAFDAELRHNSSLQLLLGISIECHELRALGILPHSQRGVWGRAL
jgi:hypothetical protein